MLIDKNYYDYDYSEPKPKIERHQRTAEQTQAIFSRMGFGKVKKLGDSMTAEELQAEALKEKQLK